MRSSLAFTLKLITLRFIMSLKIQLYGADVLRKIAEPITTFDTSVQSFARLMLETMYVENGLGLAAPQVNRSIQMIVIDTSSSRRTPSDSDYILDGKSIPANILFPLTMINPKIVQQSDLTIEAEEGCLSLPGITVKIRRPVHIGVDFLDIEGQAHHLIATNLLSRCIQHEIDHLQGKLIIDYTSAGAKARLRTKLVQLKRQQKRQ